MSLKNIILTGSIGSIPTQSYGQKMYISSNLKLVSSWSDKVLSFPFQ